MPVVLFVCTANRYRSPIAAACFKRELASRGLQEGWQVLSAGTWATEGLPAAADAIMDAKRLGLELGDHRSRVITAQLVEQADLIVVMEQGHKEALQNEFPEGAHKVQLLSEIATGTRYDIPDPAGSLGAAGVEIEIQELLDKSFDRIRAILSVDKRAHNEKMAATSSARDRAGASRERGAPEAEDT